ncbi:hypothetical protein D3273_23435 [Lichenibacterium minor]|uniref:Uncharacterized protein n=1 Tax=Lichenibacterium minor TaxID=2316528 RepID=A0A4Q2TZU8_9HYPH|nr:hypothetical protein [Lichenibacterium minor]RYC29542.1 hypothetical protein D3273_23435 [Lichenibacterium minor]
MTRNMGQRACRQKANLLKRVAVASTLAVTGGVAWGKDPLLDLFTPTPHQTPSIQKRVNFAGFDIFRYRPDQGPLLRIYGPNSLDQKNPVVTVNPDDNLVFIDWVEVQKCAAHWLEREAGPPNDLVAGICRALVSARTDGWRSAGRTGDAPEVTP